jgi:hypothetical protein
VALSFAPFAPCCNKYCATALHSSLSSSPSVLRFTNCTIANTSAGDALLSSKWVDYHIANHITFLGGNGNTLFTDAGKLFY